MIPESVKDLKRFAQELQDTLVNLLYVLRLNGGQAAIIIAENQPFNSRLIIQHDGQYIITSAMNEKGYLLHQPSLDTLLEKFGILTDPDMAIFVGLLSLYDDDPEMYYRERRKYVEKNNRQLLESFIGAMQLALDKLITSRTALYDPKKLK